MYDASMDVAANDKPFAWLARDHEASEQIEAMKQRILEDLQFPLKYASK